ncbi:unnamed protein product, partial [Chrysoparadoxa australica]
MYRTSLSRYQPQPFHYGVKAKSCSQCNSWRKRSKCKGVGDQCLNGLLVLAPVSGEDFQPSSTAVAYHRTVLAQPPMQGIADEDLFTDKKQAPTCRHHDLMGRVLLYVPVHMHG